MGTMVVEEGGKREERSIRGSNPVEDLDSIDLCGEKGKEEKKVLTICLGLGAMDDVKMYSSYSFCSREFTHRVKSFSMAKFTSQEVEALQKGGNQAREIYLKSWNPQSQWLPNNSNVDKVRDFIKTVYVDKRYVVAESSDRPPRDAQIAPPEKYQEMFGAYEALKQYFAGGMDTFGAVVQWRRLREGPSQFLDLDY
ncbi:putative ADP-ribosylation factor GTPase-activating protein AGD14 [Capsicum baccatum]|uniref:ADP-ribosylation factor GTPase-activating protein AGD14 n=1 Tax=Capsicum baccatum TaxID=33114 RepID=A0A2G2W163_CAPBA|nr:putative ADP-ribosylation factor GTPase-activating protein AGD14 [Capsicum baccatum]